MIRVVYCSLVFFVAGLVACQPPASEEPAMPETEMAETAEPAALSAEDLASIEETTQMWVDAVLASDWEGLGATYTEDARLMPPNHEVVEGRAAIQEFFSGFPPISEARLDPIEIEGVGDVAYVRGNYTLTMRPEGGEPVSDSGKYIEIRQKQADGSWLLHRDIYNSNLPLPE